MELITENVEAVARDCRFTNDELAELEGEPSEDNLPEGAVVVPGVIRTFVFHPGRLESHRADVVSMIEQLPTEFLREGGGGWTFLNLCMRRDGVQWTSFQTAQESLYVLAAGLGLARFQLPREVWEALPGAMPYLVFSTTPFDDAEKEKDAVNKDPEGEAA